VDFYQRIKENHQLIEPIGRKWGSNEVNGGGEEQRRKRRRKPIREKSGENFKRKGGEESYKTKVHEVKKNDISRKGEKKESSQKRR